ncbi:hypothetical protein MPTK1_4g14310 [Marchantia polymorpha subsp. ruderalis]|uniref:Uncharacterized protein n=2 Tax=Marchantia polymorpha TaxID=3197 RepID=A0AAF6B9T1_MARPO|nr:hypothetical protein MARPO_0070s0051 [Marchantia polymorpha]BBN08765.1 hypothetical protein Mp_4g14310 [Marchantia polymorpha subsp. ruderalis]|eukprot:PTQ35588.1 hypothetical protein MARPO_0070s0051 [Marchantia polymorpha]
MVKGYSSRRPRGRNTQLYTGTSREAAPAIDTSMTGWLRSSGLFRVTPSFSFLLGIGNRRGRFFKSFGRQGSKGRSNGTGGKGRKSKAAQRTSEGRQNHQIIDIALLLESTNRWERAQLFRYVVAQKKPAMIHRPLRAEIKIHDVRTRVSYWRSRHLCWVGDGPFTPFLSALAQRHELRRRQ